MNAPYDGYGRRDNLVRVGDADRDRAISLLGVHFADGRLSITEYDERCRAVAAAETRAQISEQFSDLPALPVTPAGISGAEVTVYSAAEIEQYHRRGADPRAGIMALTGVAGVTVAVLLGSVASIIPVMAIAVVAILLYVMKIGPESWNVPSPAALERARVRRVRQARQLELEEKRVQRRIRQTELTTDAIDMAHRVIGKTGRNVNNSWEQWRRK